MAHLIKSVIDREKIKIKAIKIEYSQIVNEKTLPRASGIWEANRTKPRHKNVGSIFKTSFRRLRKNVLVFFFFYIPAKNFNDDVN